MTAEKVSQDGEEERLRAAAKTRDDQARKEGPMPSYTPKANPARNRSIAT